MSLLDCLCCPRRCKNRVALAWDDLFHPAAVETYSNLVERACRIACYLRKTLLPPLGSVEHGGTSALPVGVYGANSPEVVSCLLGVMAVPAAYVPVDRELPVGSKVEVLTRLAARAIMVHLTAVKDFVQQDWCAYGAVFHFDITLMNDGFVIAFLQHQPTPVSSLPLPNLQDTGLTSCTGTVLCRECEDLLSAVSHARSRHDGSLSEALECYQTDLHPLMPPTHCTDGSPSPTPVQSITTRWAFPSIPPHTLAYMVTTSGTTGRPKPVKVPHCCVVPNIADLRRRFSIDSDDVILNAAPLTFDPSVIETFLALSSGASLLTVPEEIKRCPAHLATVIFRCQSVTVMQVTPALVYRMPEGEIREGLLGEGSRVRVLAFGGENCPRLALLAKWKHPQNRTEIFNIYGTTEVSTWATCYFISSHALRGASLQHHEPRQPLGEQQSETGQGTGEELGLADLVPIGESLLGTRLEVRDQRGQSIDGGVGELWIGGKYRVCMINAECALTPNTMRPTGDCGYIDAEGQVYCLGRHDRQIKRSGHRINLDAIQQTLQEHSAISACVVASLPHNSPLMDHLHLHPSPLQVSLIAFVVPTAVEELSTKGAIQKLLLALKSSFVITLPSYCIPDDVILVKYLPMNEHGKVNMKDLVSGKHLELYLTITSASSLPSVVGSPTLLEVEEILRSTALHTAGIGHWPEDACILQLGANSFDVVRISNQFEGDLGLSTGQPPPVMDELVEHLLSKSLSHVTKYVLERIHSVGVDLDVPGAADGGGARKRARYDGSSSELRKTGGKKLQVLPDKVVVLQCRTWSRGQQFTDGRLQTYVVDSKTLRMLGAGNTATRTLSFGFHRKWSVCTGQCVDASPLVVQRPGSEPVAYIGSHSGLFLAIGVHSGVVQWQSQLGSRIIGSACASRCGAYITVGTHEGCVCTLHADSGELHWCFQTPTRERCNSSPCVDPETGLVWIGSHDQHVYGLDIQGKTAVHRLFVLGGSCYPSPCLDSEARVLYCATLRGNVVAVNLDTADVKLLFHCGKPIFSSPSLLPGGGVAVGCVDGCVYVLDGQGILISQLCTNNSIFSSVCVAQVSPIGSELGIEGKEAKAGQWRMFCGSHDKCVYCWNERFELVWRVELDSEVFSVPCLCYLPLDDRAPGFALSLSVDIDLSGLKSKACTVTGKHTDSMMFSCVCVCSTVGTIHLLDVSTGSVLGSHRLPSDVFSSPISPVDGHILVGCRDDRVYCVTCKVIKPKEIALCSE